MANGSSNNRFDSGRADSIARNSAMYSAVRLAWFSFTQYTVRWRGVLGASHGVSR